MNEKLPISEGPKSANTWHVRMFMAVIGFLFAAMGAGFLIHGTLWPMWRAGASGDWQQTDCKITVSRIEVHRGEDNDTYSPNVEFDYFLDGRAFQGDEVDFNVFNRSRSACQKIVKRYPVGKETKCFYDPLSPENAVLEKEFTFSFMAVAVPLVFLLVGLGVVALAIMNFDQSSAAKNTRPKKTPKKSFTHSSSQFADRQSNAIGSNFINDNRPTVASTMKENESESPADKDDQAWDRPQRLKPTNSIWGRIVGLLFIAVFWNGVVSVFLYQVFWGEAFGFVSWFMLLFLVPFVLVGGLMIAGLFHQLLSLLNPAVELATSTGAVGRGNTLDVAWELKGNVGRLNRLQIRIQGIESATYRSGTDTLTATEVFASIVVVDTEDHDAMNFGSSSVVMPADTMHSFDGGSNEIRWELVVVGTIRMWPDISESYSIRVKP